MKLQKPIGYIIKLKAGETVEWCERDPFFNWGVGLNLSHLNLPIINLPDGIKSLRKRISLGSESLCEIEFKDGHTKVFRMRETDYGMELESSPQQITTTEILS